MTPMRASLLLFFSFTLFACDDVNKPAYVPKSEPRTTCFTDVECPGSKCVKPSANEIQGHCASAPANASDAGAPTSTDEAGVPKPGPGDISL
jgi:hypothetical protein